jgi:hypothetical protein
VYIDPWKIPKTGRRTQEPKRHTLRLKSGIGTILENLTLFASNETVTKRFLIFLVKKKCSLNIFYTHIQISAFISWSDMCMISEIPPKFSSQILHPIFYYETVQFSPWRKKKYTIHIYSEWLRSHNVPISTVEDIILQNYSLLCLNYQFQQSPRSSHSMPDDFLQLFIWWNHHEQRSMKSQVIYVECHLLHGHDDVILQ